LKILPVAMVEFLNCFLVLMVKLLMVVYFLGTLGK
jgi:hypothetical protein